MTKSWKKHKRKTYVYENNLFRLNEGKKIHNDFGPKYNEKTIPILINEEEQKRKFREKLDFISIKLGLFGFITWF